MHIALSEDQTMLQDSLERVLREQSTSARVRAAEPLGFDQALWAILVEQGIPMLRVPEPHGSDMSLMHAVVAAELAGRYLASAPVVESIVTSRLLAKLGGDALPLLEECLAGTSIATLALHDVGTLAAQMVPAGAIAKVVVCIEGDAVTLRSGFKVPTDAIHGSVPSRELNFASAAKSVRVGGKDAKALFAAAVEEWKLLSAAQIAAAARRVLELAGEYACERVAFGRKIGEYQGVSHALADALTDIEGSRLLNWGVVDKIARGDKAAAATVSMAYWWAGTAGRLATVKAMRVFGGYGMSMEYDAQLYFRRVNAWSLVAGAPDLELDRVAARLWSGATTTLPEAGDTGIDFDYGPDAHEAAARMRAFCEKHHNPAMERFMRDSLDGYDLDLYKKMAKEGLLYPDFPKEIGGPGLSGRAAVAVGDVLGDYWWVLLVPGVTDIIGKMIFYAGSEEAKNDILPGILTGEKYCSMGYSEPSGGSDIFAARTTATRESDKPGSDWLINGQKMFTSSGHRADYSLMITRTGPDKYKGITMFIVPVKQPGYQVTEIKTIGDDRTNVTFYSDVRVPDKYRLGEVNGGVKIMALALQIEQSAGTLYVSGLKHMLRHALQWAQTEKNGKKPIDDARTRLLIAEVATRLEIQDTMTHYCTWASEHKLMQKYQGPMAKLFGSESWLWCSEKLLAAAAPDSLEIGYQGAGMVEWMARRSIPGTIYAGTSEVQRSIIAESGLKLPRTRG
jgi:alkylation response protein AidB-like acyl-CoA dehydrogenase